MMGVSLNQYDMTSSQHSNAWDAMQIAKIVRSRASVAIHHSTFSPEDEARGTTVSQPLVVLASMILMIS